MLETIFIRFSTLYGYHWTKQVNALYSKQLLEKGWLAVFSNMEIEDARRTLRYLESSLNHEFNDCPPTALEFYKLFTALKKASQIDSFFDEHISDKAKACLPIIGRHLYSRRRASVHDLMKIAKDLEGEDKDSFMEALIFMLTDRDYRNHIKSMDLDEIGDMAEMHRYE